MIAALPSAVPETNDEVLIDRVDDAIDPSRLPPPDRAPETSEGGFSELMAEVIGLIEQGKTFARAELAFQTARAALVGAAVRNIALYGLFALIFVFFALGGLTIGLILTLTPLVGALGATAIVVLTLLIGAAVLGKLALSTWRRLRGALSDGGTER